MEKDTCLLLVVYILLKNNFLGQLPEVGHFAFITIILQSVVHTQLAPYQYYYNSESLHFLECPLSLG